MARKKKNRYDDTKEPFNRYCPICGEDIKKGSPLHRCSDDRIKQAERDSILFERNLNDEHSDQNRSYCDRMEEFDYYFNEDPDCEEEF